MTVMTVCRAKGLRVVIFIHDQDPAHVRVFGNGEVRSIWLTRLWESLIHPGH